VSLRRPISTGSGVTPGIDSFSEQHVDVPTVTFVARTSTRWPAVPENVATAFWPGTEPTESVVGPFNGTDTSGGTSWSVTVAEPVSIPSGSTTTRYSPVVGSTFVSTKSPFRPNSAPANTPGTDT
jgi:hypothetical protein